MKPAPITPTRYLETQWTRSVALGWVKFFLEAAALRDNPFDAADLMGIASRETNLDPKWLTKPGDNGNGFGLMQADVRSYPEWIKSGKWRDAREGILMGALVLAEKLNDTLLCENRLRAVKSSKGGTYSFEGKKLDPRERRRVAIAAYNCGRWAHYHVSKGNPVDRGTTGRNYSLDVLQRAEFFRQKLAQYNQAAAAAVGGGLPPTAAPPATTDNALKDFSRKYLKHTPTDRVRNIALVVTSRVGAASVAVWQLGVTGKVLACLAVIALGAPIVYALVYYRARLFGWAKQIFEGLFGN